MLAVFAEFETSLRRERQLEGIAKAKAAGVYKGRPALIDADRVRRLKSEGIGASAIAKQLKIGRASVYRVLCRNAELTARRCALGYLRDARLGVPRVAVTSHRMRYKRNETIKGTFRLRQRLQGQGMEAFKVRALSKLEIGPTTS
jgi:hypothetical protein